MTIKRTPATDSPARTATLVTVEILGNVAHLRLNRAAKRNALSDSLIEALRLAVSSIPDTVGAIVLSGAGEHFCAGLDLSELKDRSAAQGLSHSRSWHAVFEEIQFGRVPVIVVLHGAVVGGGLELACSAHLRVAESSAFFGLPEGQRGLFLGGGGSARIPRLIGFSRVTDMMLTGRVLDATKAEEIGLVHYLVGAGEGLAKAIELGRRVAANAVLSNYAIMHALPRIAELNQNQGLFTESLMAAIAQSDGEAKDRMHAFLDGRAGKVGKE